jgi:hypothetical protein
MFRKKESRAVLLTDALECMFPCKSLVNFAKYDTFDRFNSKLQISFKTARDSFFLNIFWNVLLIDLGPYDSFLSTVWCVSIILNITAIAQVYLTSVDRYHIIN